MGVWDSTCCVGPVAKGLNPIPIELALERHMEVNGKTERDLNWFKSDLLLIPSSAAPDSAPQGRYSSTSQRLQLYISYSSTLEYSTVVQSTKALINMSLTLLTQYCPSTINTNIVQKLNKERCGLSWKKEITNVRITMRQHQLINKYLEAAANRFSLTYHVYELSKQFVTGLIFCGSVEKSPGLWKAGATAPVPHGLLTLSASLCPCSMELQQELLKEHNFHPCPGTKEDKNPILLGSVLKNQGSTNATDDATQPDCFERGVTQGPELLAFYVFCLLSHQQNHSGAQEEYPGQAAEAELQEQFPKTSDRQTPRGGGLAASQNGQAGILS
ncbi:hypothetical protein EK904_013878 [Melospiza melodia maxima]|nr:hypothetical protein EK904_013878 [Melospiza melodia maxima]